MAEKATYKIKPEILEFMRKSAGLSQEDVAKKLKLQKSEYFSIENGEERVPQNILFDLADLYKRPLVAFYTIDTKQNIELPHDFRLNRDKKISPQVYLAKRKALYLAGELKEITERKTELPDLDTNVPATVLADQVWRILDIDYAILKEVVASKDETALGYYKSLIEEKFFIPIIEHPLKTNGVRAFSVFGEVSVMVLNESDQDEVKLFSLFHEFCHLLKRQDGICTVDIENDEHNEPDERYCDEFTAILLMPEQEVRESIKEYPVTGKQLNDTAKAFGVSKLVTLIRFKELGILNPGRYKRLKTELESVQKKPGGRRNWEQTFIKRTSRLVLNNLIASYKKGDLTYTSLSTITGIKDKYLQKLI